MRRKAEAIALLLQPTLQRMLGESVPSLPE